MSKGLLASVAIVFAGASSALAQVPLNQMPVMGPAAPAPPTVTTGPVSLEQPIMGPMSGPVYSRAAGPGLFARRQLQQLRPSDCDRVWRGPSTCSGGRSPARRRPRWRPASPRALRPAAPRCPVPLAEPARRSPSAATTSTWERDKASKARSASGSTKGTPSGWKALTSTWGRPAKRRLHLRWAEPPHRPCRLRSST